MAAPISLRKEIRTIRTFRSLATLRILNVIAVGASLAGATGTVFAAVATGGGGDTFTMVSSISTFLFGLGWASLLRARPAPGHRGWRRGWLAAVPLAMGNAAVSCAALGLGSGDSLVENLLKGAFLGATVGAVIWVPALIATLLVFGYPIGWAQKRADEGLAGEERGEVVVGAVSASIASLSLAWFVGMFVSRAAALEDSPPSVPEAVVVGALASLGLLAGALASGFAAHRGRVRRKFVSEVASGAVDGYRVDETAQGKVLVRVTMQGTGYRVANFEEMLAVIDDKDEGEASLTERSPWERR